MIPSKIPKIEIFPTDKNIIEKIYKSIAQVSVNDTRKWNKCGWCDALLQEGPYCSQECSNWAQEDLSIPVENNIN